MKTLLFLLAFIASSRADFFLDARADSLFHVGHEYVFQVVVDNPNCREMQPCFFLAYDGAQALGGPGPYHGDVGDTVVFIFTFDEKAFKTLPARLALTLSGVGKPDYHWIIRLDRPAATPVKLKNPFVKKRFGFLNRRIDGRAIPIKMFVVL